MKTGRPLPGIPGETDQLLVSARHLAALLDLSIRTIRRMDVDGRLPQSLRLGSAVRWNLPEIKRWIAAGTPPRDEWEARKRRRR